jgi:uncharacterized protein YcnI
MKMVAATILLSCGSAAAAHVTVWPKVSQAGAHEKYEVRVPNEKQVDTLSVEVRFPNGVRVRSFEHKPGWTAEPLRDSSGAIVGVRWTGRLPPNHFTEFGLLAANPSSGADLVWPATQTFADGTRVEWTGAKGSKTPAPHVTIEAGH